MDVFRPPSVFRDGSCFANDNRGALSTPHTFSFHPSHPFCLFINDCASLLEQLHLSIASVAWWSFHRKADADSSSTGADAERSGMDSEVHPPTARGGSRGDSTYWLSRHSAFQSS